MARSGRKKKQSYIILNFEIKASVLEPFPDAIEDQFREMWTRNADVLSVLYTGTGALKTDFTRTGKRTKLGALKDG